MKISKYGQLLEKFNRSGINKNPKITNEELEYLIDFSEGLIGLAIDIGDQPLALYFEEQNKMFKKIKG